ncbi:MAG: hypothetical protein M3Y45_07055 [Actinomycetota bacterium]|nr:hypothetical protein [Actinomycetota bacterium]
MRKKRIRISEQYGGHPGCFAGAAEATHGVYRAEHRNQPLVLDPSLNLPPGDPGAQELLT